MNTEFWANTSESQSSIYIQKNSNNAQLHLIISLVIYFSRITQMNLRNCAAKAGIGGSEKKKKMLT